MNDAATNINDHGSYSFILVSLMLLDQREFANGANVTLYLLAWVRYSSTLLK